jgi:hypothetical protein
MVGIEVHMQAKPLLGKLIIGHVFFKKTIKILFVWLVVD